MAVVYGFTIFYKDNREPVEKKFLSKGERDKQLKAYRNNDLVDKCVPFKKQYK